MCYQLVLGLAFPSTHPLQHVHIAQRESIVSSGADERCKQPPKASPMGQNLAEVGQNEVASSEPQLHRIVPREKQRVYKMEKEQTAPRCRTGRTGQEPGGKNGRFLKMLLHALSPAGCEALRHGTSVRILWCQRKNGGGREKRPCDIEKNGE